MSHFPRLVLQPGRTTGRLAADPPSNCSEGGGPCLREREAGRGDRHTARTVHNAFQGLKEKSANYCSKSREFSIKT